MGLILRKFSIALLLLLYPALAQAQAYQCRAPQSLSAPPAYRPADEPRRVKPVAGYLLALSWSPEFCRTRKDMPRARTQCGGQDGSFGFILHGLWPEARDSSYPRWCRPAQPLPEALVKRHFCAMPSAALQARQWAKHGGCMTKAPATYFAVAQTLFDAVRFPDMDALSRRRVTVAQFVQRFALANDGLQPAMIRVKLNERGWLEEVRLCLGTDFRPRACPAHVQGARGDSVLKIWRGA